MSIDAISGHYIVFDGNGSIDKWLRSACILARVCARREMARAAMFQRESEVKIVGIRFVDTKTKEVQHFAYISIQI